LKAGGINSLVASALVLLLPLALTLWFRRRALAAPVAARPAVWFWSFRFLRYLTLGTIALWWVSTDLIGLKAVARLLWLEYTPAWIPASQAIFLFCFWIPPMVAIVSCQALFQPVYAQIREVDWTRSELALQAALGLGVSLLPVLFAVAGVLELTGGGGLADFALSYLLAVLSAIGSAHALRKHLELTPSALTTGDLRDRAFSLAGRLGVKLEQIYLLPPGKSRLANAFARSGNSILLTEILLTNLNKREVDAVIGHELSHLKKDHPRLLGFALLGGLAMVMTPYFFLAPGPNWQPVFDVLFIVVPLASFYFVSRRFEYAADSGSLQLTGDPAAMITGLVKLHHLNLMPLEWSKWSEKALTHPSTVRRARAIGRAAEMSPDRVDQLLAAPNLAAPDGAEEHYLAPPGSLRPKVFSSEFKRQASLGALLGFAALAFLLPSLVLRALGQLPWPERGWQAFALGLLLCLAATLVFANRVPFLGYRGLCRRLRAKLAAEGVPVDRSDALLVGLAPGNRPRIFESNYSWDVGCLLLAADRLCYWGEETRFALRRDQIVSLEPGPGMPGWVPTQFLYIRWRPAAGQREITFNIRPLAASSLGSMRLAFGSLRQRMSSWHSASPDSEAAGEDARSLPLPPAGEVTSSPVSAARDPRQILAILLFTALASGIAARWLKLPMEWVDRIVLPRDPGGEAAVSGWYAILISALLVLVRFGPVWFRREPEPKPAPAIAPPPVPSGKPGPSDAR
jgi:heat shock protein HtpX